MNATKPIPIIEGMKVICVDMIDAELSVESGEIYVVRRTKSGGPPYEWTVKRAQVFKDRIELYPESTNPIHKPIVIDRDHSGEDGSEVLFVGLVQSIYAGIGR